MVFFPPPPKGGYLSLLSELWLSVVSPTPKPGGIFPESNLCLGFQIVPPWAEVLASVAISLN